MASLIWLSLGIHPGNADPLPPEEIYRKALPSLMTLDVETRGGGRLIGTGFLAIREGVAVTAWHLLPEARKVTARFADGATVDVIGVLDFDELHDVALIQMDLLHQRIAPLCTTNPAVGARVYALGSPMGYEFSISEGLINQEQTVDGFLQHQFSCPISPGNSGGPLLNIAGEVIGVVTWSQKDAQNLNFATPAGCLLSLNARAEAVPWINLKRQRALRKETQSNRSETELAGDLPEDRDLIALRTLLKHSVGQQIEVTVRRTTETNRFRITVPKKLVR